MRCISGYSSLADEKVHALRGPVCLGLRVANSAASIHELLSDKTANCTARLYASQEPGFPRARAFSALIAGRRKRFRGGPRQPI